MTYSVVGNLLTATVTGGARIGTALFTVAITDAATGAYTVTLLDNVLHAGGPNDEATDATVNLGYVITDADGSPVTGNTLTITFDDDAPTAILPDHAEAQNEAGETFVGALDTNSNVNNNAGADGLGSVRFPTSLNGTKSQLTSGGLPIIYYVSADGHTLTGAVGPNAATGPNFTIVLTDATTDTYALTMIGTVDGGATHVNFDLTAGYDFEGGNSSWLAFFKAGDNDSNDL